jgi:lactose/L-arabinose transport system ATP-binding protein
MMAATAPSSPSASALSLRAVRKRFGDTDIIRGVDLEIHPGELVVFVGPSGCGKSTLLRMIAGLESVSDGTIHIAGRDVTALPPSARQVAMVFQSYALYPHMTVRENLTFGMRMRGVAKSVIAEKVKMAVDMLRLEPYLDRKPGALSGGQAQRVAIGRALVQEPQIFLFDEPLSNLDAELRLKTRVELAALHKELGRTMIYVTHDQVEAMTLADKIVVLRDGVIEQVGAPMDLYRAPANKFVAGFIGSPAMNFLDATFDGDGATLHDGTRVALGDTATSGKGSIGVRPEHVRIDPNGLFAARVTVVERLGATSYVYAQALGQSICIESREDVAVSTGRDIRVSFDPTSTHRFDEKGRRTA